MTIADDLPRSRSRRSPVLGLRLCNVRAFEDTGELTLARVNFIFGKNSSGKTTILRSPLLLKQLTEATSLTGEVPLGGPFVDFGSYSELVFNGLRSRDIELIYDCDLGTRNPASRRRSLVGNSTSLRVGIRLHWNATRGHSQINHIDIRDQRDRQIIKFLRRSPEIIRIECPPASLAFDARGYGELSLRTLQLLDLTTDPGDNPLTDIELSGFVIFDSIRRATLQIQHIGPLRDMPERAYRQDQLVAPGAVTPHTLALMSTNQSVLGAARQALQDLRIARDITVTRPAPGYAGITVTDINSGRKDNLADVGFGISQVLPIIVQLASAPPNSLVLIEQPELHLHPETQGALLDVMLRLADQRRLTLLVESHSENMLLRLRRQVASGNLQPDEVRVYVTNQGQVHRAAVQENGNIDMKVFPADFFEEEWLEAVELAKLAGRRAGGAE